MKSLRTLLIVLLVSVFCCMSASADWWDYMQVTNCNEYVTLRSYASTSAPAVAYVPVGEVVVGQMGQGNFAYCCYNGKYGYILANYLSYNIYRYSEGNFRVSNCNSYITLRDWPSTSGRDLAHIPLGTVITDIYYGDHSYDPDAFAFVRYNGQCGFVLWRYLSYTGW